MVPKYLRGYHDRYGRSAKWVVILWHGLLPFLFLDDIV